ncbi:MAG: Piwi domain-containing protein [Balneolaceae bacterium]
MKSKSTNSTITLNVIPLNLEEEALKCSFYKENHNGQNLVPLTPQEMPKNLSDMYTEPLYTDFSIREDASTTVTVKYKISPRFAKHYLNYRLYNWFQGRARLRKKDFVRNNEFYFIAGEDEKNDIVMFDRFTVRGTYQRLTDGFELTVMYSGTMKVWKKPVYEYPGVSTDLRKVVYKGEVYPYEDLMEKGQADRKEMYPVVNRDVADALNLPAPGWKKINKLKRHTEKIDWFYNEFICDADFRKTFQPSDSGYMAVKEEELSRLPPKAANLLFGGRVVDKNPYEGMKNGGPYQPPAVSHIELFLIVAEDDAKTIGNSLYNMLKKGKGHFPGLNRYARVPVHHSEHHLTYTDMENPLPEIQQHLQQMNLKEGVHYGAVYVSPIHKDNPDPEKHRVYYRVKEELLKHNITSQVIDRNSVTDSSFAYYLPNIAVALLAKLGGVPWTLERKTRKELVIGVGAYSPNRRRKTYLGSAFCFSNNGDFRGFDSFTADNHLMLAGSFQKAIRQFKEENKEVERVVIHYYKKMNREEAAMVKQALKELNMDIPVVILTIHKSKSKDLVLSDRAIGHRLPLSGTWMKSGFNQFLLCNNTRFDETDEKIRSYPFPVKVYFDIAEENKPEEGTKPLLDQYLDDPEWVEELLEQVYQFSRLNWQTVSVKDLPVTVRYPEMVARKFPYFAGDVIPEFGKHNFWFL